MNAPLFFESAGDERGTPQDFFDRLHAEFHFDIDCAASPRNKKCEIYFGEGGIAPDALEEDWGGMMCFLNPPYSVAGAFVAKAREEADKGATVVLLLPVRSDTKWWHGHIYDKDASLVRLVERSHKDGDWRPGVRVRFIPGRLNFELTVPADLRAWIKSEVQSAYDEPGATQRDVAEKIRQLVEVTGLPKMAIERIYADQPDDCLLDAAPFPSCVVIFTKS